MTTKTTALAIIEPLKAEVVFAKGGAGVTDVLDKVRNRVDEFEADISTEDGRSDIKSFAYEIARTKTGLDEMGKTLVEDMKKQTSAVDKERKRIRDECDFLKDKVRAPLTKWEKGEEDRVAGHEAAILSMTVLTTFRLPEPTPDEVLGRLAGLSRIADRQWQEFAERATKTELHVRALLDADLDAALRREKDRAELEELRRLNAERQEQLRKEQEEKARAAAEQERAALLEKARQDAEVRAQEAARAKIEAAERERQKVEQEKVDAERRAAEFQATAERLVAEAKENEVRVEQERQAAKVAEAARIAGAMEAYEAQRVAAEEQAERAKAEAVDNERRRVASEEAAAAAVTANRVANIEYRRTINQKITADLMELNLFVDDSQARKVMFALVGGKISHVKVEY